MKTIKFLDWLNIFFIGNQLIVSNFLFELRTIMFSCRKYWMYLFGNCFPSAWVKRYLVLFSPNQLLNLWPAWRLAIQIGKCHMIVCVVLQFVLSMQEFRFGTNFVNHFWRHLLLWFSFIQYTTLNMWHLDVV